MSDLVMWGVYFSALYVAVFWLIVLIEEWARKEEEVDSDYEPAVSIIIPAYNEEEHVAECIQSVLDMDYPREKLEVIVVNDGSTDGTLAECRKFKDKIKLINLKKNSGSKAVPLNKGLAVASGEIFGGLDADSYVTPEALKRMLPHFAEREVAAVTPALKVSRPKNLLQKLQWFEYLFAILLRKLMSLINCIYVTPGPFSLYRREVVKKLGGFDEKNITEDMELALRLQAHHYKIKNAVDAYVLTSAPADGRGLYAQRRRWYYGLIYNSVKYKNIFFNPEYGDFSILMPLNVMSVLVLMASTGLFAYYLIKPVVEHLLKLLLVDFDLLPYLASFNLNWIMWDINYLKLFVIIAVVVMGLVSLVLSHWFARERILKYGLRPVLYFTMFYFLFLGFLWIGTIGGLIRDRKVRWSG